MTMAEFRQRQGELRRRIGRQPSRSLVRRRLERELRGLVLQALQQEVVPELARVPYPDDEGQPLKYWQK